MKSIAPTKQVSNTGDFFWSDITLQQFVLTSHRYGKENKYSFLGKVFIPINNKPKWIGVYTSTLDEDRRLFK